MFGRKFSRKDKSHIWSHVPKKMKDYFHKKATEHKVTNYINSDIIEDTACQKNSICDYFDDGYFNLLKEQEKLTISKVFQPGSISEREIGDVMFPFQILDNSKVEGKRNEDGTYQFLIDDL